MGNRIAARRNSWDEPVSCPEASISCQGMDQRSLRRRILNGELAPRHPGVEEYAPELDECPICFLFYPSLNRSSCCSKSICTDCYLQIKSTCYTPYGNCPFCKTAKYMVEYRGAKTAEERYFEQAEEQKVIEAKIRIRQKELRDEEQFVKEGEDIPVEERYLASRRGHGLGSDSENFHRYQESFELEESQLSGEFDFYEESRQHPNGEDDTYLDMEEELLLKAIEMSIKDLQQGREESALSPRSVQDSAMPGCGSRRRRRNGGSSGLHDAIEINSQVASGSKSVVDSQNFSQGRSVNCGDFDTRSDTIEIPQRCFGAHGATRKDEAALLGKTEMQNFSSQTCQDFHEKLIRSSGTAYVIPENYDEQIMLAMALSLADDYV